MPIPSETVLANQLRHGQGITLVHDWLTGKRGGEKCLARISHLLHQAELVTLLHQRGSSFDEIERLPIRQSWIGRLPKVENYYRYLLPMMPHAIESLGISESTRCILSFSHAVAKGIQAPAEVPHVCYCFTPMRYAWGLRNDYLNASSLSGKLKSFLLDRLQQWDAKTSSRVTKFVAISQTVADRIKQYYGRESEVIYPPVDTDFFHPEPSTDSGDYYLCVSALVPYKRLDLAIAACKRLGRKLVVIGDGPQRKKLERIAGPDTQFLGWVDDQTLRAYYRSCRALLFPGTEDFGIVPIEVQACGKPVIAFARGGATETVIGPNHQQAGTGMFFQHQTVSSLLRAVQRFENNPTMVDSQRCRENALRFHTQRFEQELLRVLFTAIESKQREGVLPAAA